MITEQNVLDSLKGIIDPDLNQDIVSLGFVQNVQINEDNVSFDIQLTTPACPVKGEFERQAKEAVLKLAGVKNVQIQMTAPARKETQNAANNPLTKVRSIIAISSCKGGVGKSTLCAHIAQEFANRGHKVGIVDADIYGPSLPTLFNLQTAKIYTNEHKQLIPVKKNNLKIMSFGFLLGDAPAIMRGPIVTQYIQQILLNVDWGELDYLFIDMPPGTGDVQITITQTLRLSGAIIVTTPHTLSMIDVARGILMFEKVSVPILGVIENMSFFKAPGSDQEHKVFGEYHGPSLKERFGVETLGEIPIMPELTKSIDQPDVNQIIFNVADNAARAIGKMSVLQKQTPAIYCDEEMITLTWSDGKKQSVENFNLRLNSMDALSVNELTGERIIKPEDIPKDIRAKKVTPLGNYALGVEWSDGHTAGIYPYTLINKLAKN